MITRIWVYKQNERQLNIIVMLVVETLNMLNVRARITLKSVRPHCCLISILLSFEIRLKRISLYLRNHLISAILKSVHQFCSQLCEK